MPLHLHNTLTGSKQRFTPLSPGKVLFYSCGPTVYDFAHIGNFRSFLAADVLRRWLESPLCERLLPDGSPDEDPSGGGNAGGYAVTQVMNITDVGHMTEDGSADGGGEDKMVAAAQRLLEDKKSGKLPEGASESLDPKNPYDIAGYYTQAFKEDALKLGMLVVEDAIDHPEFMPTATGSIRGMLAMVLELLDKGFAYTASDGATYFRTAAFPDYGRLSGNTLDAIRSGAGGRVDEGNQSVKEHPADFLLWKPDPTHLMRWAPPEVLKGDAEAMERLSRFPLGEGYPGWHIECSAMARAALGEEIDLHSGGEDNIFPHHECEIAQSRCATGQDHFARYWFHPRFLMVEGKKMSKSMGNFFTARELFGKGFSPSAVRLELIKTHYRTNANFTEQGLKDSEKMVKRLRAFRESAASAKGDGDPSRRELARREFALAMNDDLNVAGAIGALNAWVNATPNPGADDAELLALFDGVLGVLDLEAPTGAASEGDAEIDALVQERLDAKKAKDFARADEIRKSLSEQGIEITDGPGGTSTWSRKASL